MTQRPKLAAVSPEREDVDYLARVRENLALVVNAYGKMQVSRWTGLTDQTLTNLMTEDSEKPMKGAGQFRTFLDLAKYMDIPPGLWFLPADEFIEALNKRKPNPFFAPPRRQSSSASGLTASGVNRDRYGKIKRGKTASKDVGNARLVQVALDLHEDERAA